jgi:hypothetical protein
LTGIPGLRSSGSGNSSVALGSKDTIRIDAANMIKLKSLNMFTLSLEGLNRLARELQCELCGAQFECGMGGLDCWCANIRLTAENLATLRQLAKDCVCPECLTKLANGNRE